MLITQDDFKKIWASTSSVPEYTFSDSDYQDGWEFVGNLPPTRAMWDTLQRRNDQKMKFLQDNGSMCFDSVADMVASNLESGQTVITKGYYSVNDGGSALYTIRAKDVADVDDGGSIIFLDNGNVAELITDGVINVKQFGAKGDGVTDDRSAFANAIAFANGKTLFVPKGDYNLASYLFADGIKEVIDNGTYTDCKPVYPDSTLMFKGYDYFQWDSTLSDADIVIGCWCQGMTYNTKTKRLLCGITSGANQLIYEYDPDSKTVINKHTFTQIGHMNSLTYCPDNNKVYSVMYSDTADQNKVAIIDADTMTYESVITFEHNVSFLSYDKVCKVFVGGYSELENSRQKFNVKIWDRSWNLIKEFSVLNEQFQGYFNGSIVANNGHALLLELANILEIDYNGAILKNNTLVNRITPSNSARPTFGQFYEFEDIAIDENGVIYMQVPNPTIGSMSVRIYKHKENIVNKGSDLAQASASGLTYLTLNTNLNSIIAPGWYFVESDQNPDVSHYPTSPFSNLQYRNGLLQVVNASISIDNQCILQIFYPRNQQGFCFRKYLKGYAGYTGQWTPWEHAQTQVLAGVSPDITVNAGQIVAERVTFGTPFELSNITVTATLLGYGARNGIDITIKALANDYFEVRISNTTSDTRIVKFSWQAMYDSSLTKGTDTYTSVTP